MEKDAGKGRENQRGKKRKFVNAQTGTAWKLVDRSGRMIRDRAYIEPAAWMLVVHCKGMYVVTTYGPIDTVLATI